MRKTAQSLNSTIMIVEDEEDILEITAEVLREEGFDPVCFRYPQQALAYLRDHTPALVLTDLRLPGLSGREFIQEARSHAGAELPIAVMSAAPDVREQMCAAQVTIQGVLKKPFELEDLCDLARRFASPAPAATV